MKCYHNNTTNKNKKKTKRIAKKSLEKKEEKFKVTSPLSFRFSVFDLDGKFADFIFDFTNGILEQKFLIFLYY